MMNKIINQNGPLRTDFRNWVYIFNTGHLYNLVVFHMKMHLAADTAVTAGGSDFFRFARGVLHNGIFFWNKGAHRADLDTLPAKHAVRILKGLSPSATILDFCPGTQNLWHH